MQHFPNSETTQGPSDPDQQQVQVKSDTAVDDGRSSNHETGRKRRRRLVYKHLAGVIAPSNHITVPQALDRIGQSEFVDWGTQPSFKYMPVISTRVRGIRHFSITKTPLGTLYKITSDPLIAGPSTTVAIREFRSARKALQEAIETQQVEAIYHKTPDEFAPYPRALLSGTRAKTIPFALGVVRSAKGLWCPIFIELTSFDRWLKARRQPIEQLEPKEVRYLGVDKEGSVAEAIKLIASQTNVYPLKEELTSIIAKAVQLAGRPPVLKAEIQRIRGKLKETQFGDAGRRPKGRPSPSPDEEDKFVQAIHLVLLKKPV